jgi:hypothetical protein
LAAIWVDMAQLAIAPKIDEETRLRREAAAAFRVNCRTPTGPRHNGIIAKAAPRPPMSEEIKEKIRATARARV